MIKNPGKVTKANDGYRVVLRRELNHSIDTVWNALTDPEKLRIWFTDIEGDFRPGAEIRIFFQDKDRTVTKGLIVTMNEPVLFEFTWEDELASWKLEKLGSNRTRLTLEYSRLADNYAVSVPAGWHQLIDQLETVLDGRTTPYPFGTDPTEERKALQREYRKAVVNEFPELLEKLNDDDTIVIEKLFQANIDDVWKALTDKDQMKQWYFDLKEFKAEKGFVFEFTAGDEHKKWKHRCQIIEVITYKKISYTWQYPGYEGISLVTWELFKEEGGTKVVLKHFGLDTFPPEVPELHRRNFLEGWNTIIGESLENYLRNR